MILAPNSDKSISDKIKEFVDNAVMKEKEREKREQILHDLQAVLLQFGKVHMFGSFLTGIGNSKSDLDVYFEDTREETGKEELEILEEIANILENHEVVKIRQNKSVLTYKYCDKVKFLRDARVPILRFKPNRCSKIRIDLCCRNGTAVQNSKLIQFLFSLNPVLRPLTIVMREWASSKGLVGLRGLKSYVIALLAIVVLVRKKCLPSLQFLQSLVPPRFVNVGRGRYNVNFCEDAHLVRNKMQMETVELKQMSDLLPWILDFLNLVQTLSPEFVLCSSTGDFIPKRLFQLDNHGNLPECQRQFCKMVENQSSDEENLWEFSEFPSENQICLQDPFELDTNLLKHCRKLEEIQAAVEETKSRIQDNFLANHPFKSLFISKIEQEPNNLASNDDEGDDDLIDENNLLVTTKKSEQKQGSENWISEFDLDVF